MRKVKSELNALKAKAEKVIEKIEPFSFVAFEEALFAEKSSTIKKGRKLEDWFNDTIKRLKANDQIGTAGTYLTTINSTNKYKKKLQIQDITPTFLKEYEKHIVDNGRSLTTVGMYMRNLRAIINEAINAKMISKDTYPFTSYEIPTGQNVKKALKDFDINLLLHYQPVKEDHKKALDFWLFSYLCNGMNFADIVSLKRENVSGNFLSFYRQKTIRTKKKDLRPIKVGLNPRAIEIMVKWRNTDSADPYLFSILENGLEATTIKHRCKRLIKWVNKRMYEISAELGIENKTSTYAARHTFSTVLKRKGAPTSFIKDALGHSSVTTTENYLDTFEDDTTLEYANALTDFKPAVLKVI